MSVVPRKVYWIENEGINVDRIFPFWSRLIHQLALQHTLQHTAHIVCEIGYERRPLHVRGGQD